MVNIPNWELEDLKSFEDMDQLLSYFGQHKGLNDKFMGIYLGLTISTIKK